MTTNVPLDESLRKVIGEIITQYVDSGETQIGDAKEQWNFDRAVARDQNMSSTKGRDDTGFRIFHVPLTSVFLSSLTDQVCSVVTKQDPLMVDVSSDEQVADAKATLATRVWKKSKLPKRFRAAVDEAGITDLSFMRQCYIGDGIVELSNHSPEDVIVYPALDPDFAESTAMGHRIFKRMRDIQAKRDDDSYYVCKYEKDKQLTQKSPHDVENMGDELDRAGLSDSEGPLWKEDHPVELFDVTVLLDIKSIAKSHGVSAPSGIADGSTWYRSTIARSDRELLALEVYPYKRPWYFKVREVGGRTYPPAVSVARKLWPIQDAYNQMFSAMYAGAIMAAMPPIVTPEEISKDGEFQTFYQSGDVLKMDNAGGAPWSPSISAQLAPIPVILNNLTQLAYKTSGISENTAGGSPAEQTATAASITAAGTAVKLAGYIETATDDLPEMCAHLFEIIASDFQAFSKRYNIVPPQEPPQPGVPAPLPTVPPQVGGMAPIELSIDDIEMETEWVVSGQSPANSPQAVLQTVELMLQTAVNQMSGLDVYELVNVWVQHSPLRNSKVQISKDELAKRITAQLMAQQGAQMAAGAPGGSEPSTGNFGGLPPSPVGPGGA